MFNNADSSPIRYWPRLKIWANNSKNARVYTDAKGNFTEATSYGHWTFFKRIGKKNVFNTYYYSRQSRDHQNALEDLLKQKKIKIHVRVNTRNSLRRLNDCLEEKYSEYCKHLINSENSRRRAKARSESTRAAKVALREYHVIKSLGAKCNKREIMQRERDGELRRLRWEREHSLERAESRKIAAELKKELLANSWINVA